MRHIHSRLTVRVLLATSVLAITGALLGGSPATATPPPSSFGQSWELLDQPISASGGLTRSLDRGTLPGGTSAFDPQPTARLDVVGKVTGAAGDGRWTVALRTVLGQTLAEVGFAATDTTFSLRSDTLVWPDNDLPLRDLRLELFKTGPTDLTGTIEIRKAAIRIDQQGRIRATVGRFPLASYQDYITSSAFTDLADGGLYRHVAADFVPAPASSLRLSARATAGTGDIRVIDDLGAVVATVRLEPWSEPSTAVTLQDGRTYRLQARADQGSVVRVYSADLVLAQSTTEELGITRTVGWYPSVTFPVDATTSYTDSWQAVAAPAVDAFSYAYAFQTVAKTSVGQITQVWLQDQSKGTTVAQTQTNLTSYSLIEQTVGAISPGDLLDTRIRVTKTGGGALGIPGQTRVASSVLRLAAQLRDITAPVLTTALSATQTAISPGVSVGVKDYVDYAAVVSDQSAGLTWSIKVTPAGSSAVHREASGQITGTSGAISWRWDGKDASGAVIQGDYQARLTVTDIWNNEVASASLPIKVDTTAPVIAHLTGAPPVFSPVAAQTSLISADPFEQSTWLLEVRNPANTATLRTFTGSGTTLYDPAAPSDPLRWNGRNAAGAIQPDEDYRVRLRLTDLAGNASDNYAAPSLIGVNSYVPVISGSTISNTSFSPVLPTADSKSKTVVTATISERSTWSATVSDRTFSGTGTAVSATWDGRNVAGQIVPNGAYTVTINATDIHGSVATPVQFTTTVDTVAPVIAGLSVSPAMIDPVAGGSAQFSIDPFEQSDWSVSMKDYTSATVRTFTGTGTTLFDPAAPTQPLRWDGRTGAGAIVPDDDYTAVLILTDLAGNSANNAASPLVISVNCCAPAIGVPVLSNPRFSPVLASPNPKRETTVTASISQRSAWTVRVSDRVFTGTGTSISVLWNGRDAAGVIVPDGAYTVTLEATDVHGSPGAAVQATVTVDTRAPQAAAPLAVDNARISPNGDGSFEQVEARVTWDEDHTFAMSVTDAGGVLVRSFSGTGTAGTEVRQIWNGKKVVSGQETVVADAVYGLTMVATDAAGNVGSTPGQPTTVTVDTTAPVVQGFNRSKEYFSPSGEHVKFTAGFGDGASPWNPLAWQIDIRANASVVRQLSGNSTDGTINQADGIAWDGKDAAGNLAPDGEYSARLTVRDAGMNTHVANAELPIVLDATSPVFTDISPRDGHNTIFAAQPLQASVTDARTGIGSGGVSFTLTDRTTGIVTTPATTFDDDAGVATSAPETLLDGHDYTLSVAATDRAGNVSTETHLPYKGLAEPSSGGFRKIDVDPVPATATIAPRPCTIAAEGSERVATCSGVVLNFSDAGVDVSGSRHGYTTAFIRHSAALEEAKLKWQPLGLSMNAYDNRFLSAGASSFSESGPGGGWSPRSMQYSYRIVDRTLLPGTVTALPATPTVTVGTLRVVLPAAWALAQDVELSMESPTEFGAPAESATGACAAPLSAVGEPCDTDPLWNRFGVWLDEGLPDNEAVIAQHQQLGAEVIYTYDVEHQPGYEAVLPPDIRAAIASRSEVAKLLPMRSANLEDRYWELRRRIPATTPTVGANTISWSDSDTKITQSLALDPTAYSRVGIEQAFEASADPLPPEEGETVAGPVTDVLEMRPAVPGLSPDSAVRAGAESKVRYEVSDSSYFLEVQPVDQRGIRFVVQLIDESAPTNYAFDLRLPVGTHIETGQADSALVVRDASSGTDVPVGLFSSPFAYDANGKSVPVRQYFTSSSVRLELDLTSGDFAFPILADPEYQKLFCESVSRGFNAPYMLNDNGSCPYGITFFWANSYWPERAPTCTGVECGMRTLYRGGNCSWYPGGDTGLSYDFTVPCQMHDYGWDLIRVKSPYDYLQVNRDDADAELLLAIREHCDSRSFFLRFDCYKNGLRLMAGLKAAEISGCCNPVRGSRPSGDWPSTQLLTNRTWVGGTTGWTVGAATGGTVTSTAFEDDGTVGTRFLRSRCVTTAGCYIRQDVIREGRGGESFQGSFRGRCRATAHCSVTLRAFVKLKSDDSWGPSVATTTVTIPYSSTGVNWYDVTISPTTLLNVEYTATRWELVNNGIGKDIDIAYPSFVFNSG